MNCFEHVQKPAVAICTHCGRGLCRDCATVVKGKYCCRGNCQIEVERSLALTQKSELAMNQRLVVYETSSKVYQQAFASTAFFGLLFVIVGACLLFTRAATMGAILIGLGIVMGIRGAGLARAGRNYKALAAEDVNESSEA
jgi:hypothetical protein